MKIGIAGFDYDVRADEPYEATREVSGTFLVGVRSNMGEGYRDTLPPTPDEALTLPDLSQASSEAGLDVLLEDPWDWSDVP